MFIVLYRWRTKPGTEDRLRAAWLSATKKITARHGALGSRLHRAEDGSWVAYAQWPDRKSWERMRASPPAAPEEFDVMNELAADRGEFPFPYLTMELTDDAFASDANAR